MVHTRTFEDSILNIPEGSIGRGLGQVPCGGAPSPPTIGLEQLLAMQNDLMRRLVENNEHCGAERQQPRHQERDSSNSDFLATHLPVFADATDPLQANSWLHTTESMFGLLHCRVSKDSVRCVAAQRHSWSMVGFLHRPTLPDDHHVPWGEFHTAFRVHHLSVGLLHSKLKEFLDLEQGNHSVFDYT
jgi:hypothetical protein